MWDRHGTASRGAPAGWPTGLSWWPTRTISSGPCPIPTPDIVEGYQAGVMAGAIPARLTEDEIAAIVAYLESL